MLPAETLTGLYLDGGWHVEKIADRSLESTGGYSSFSYLVSNSKNEKAYLKAIDLSPAMQSVEFTQALEDLLKAYNFELNLLQQCKNKRLRRVVVPIAHGMVEPTGNFGSLIRQVPYLIFKMAQGDIRKEVREWEKFGRKFDLAWALRSLHQSAVGLQELHGINIAHQDIKPSNVLVFPIEGSKLADLGSASQAGNPSISNGKKVAGDVSYATPEQWYGWSQSPEFSSRYIADIYRLGSLIFFFFLRCSTTDAIQLKLSVQHGKEFMKSDFISDLPYIQYAFEEALRDLRTSVEGKAGDLTDEIVMIAKQLCEPDPRRRGDPRARAAAYRPQHDIQAYISCFDKLARKAEIRML